MLAIESGNCVKCCPLVVHGWVLDFGPVCPESLPTARFKNGIFYCLRRGGGYREIVPCFCCILFWGLQTWSFCSILLPNFCAPAAAALGGYGSDFNLWTCRCPHTHTRGITLIHLARFPCLGNSLSEAGKSRHNWTRVVGLVGFGLDGSDGLPCSVLLAF